MSPGDLVLGRYRLSAELPAAPGLRRWSARDEVEGREVEVVALEAQLALRPGAEAAFLAAAAAPSTEADALLEGGPHGRHAGRLVHARPRTRGPLPGGLRLGGDEALAWAAWLAPAATAAEDALGGRLGPEDLVVDADGTVRLAPRGIAAPREALRPDPYRAPEVAAGAPPAAGSALYGLGTLLCEALTGAPAPDPALDLGRLRPDLPPELVALLAALRAPDPSVRLAALRALPAPSPVTAPAPSPTPLAAPATPAAPPAVRTTRDSRPAPAVTPAGPWWVVVEPDALTGAARRRAEALLDLPAGRLDPPPPEAARLPLSTHASATAAGEQVALLAAQGLPAVAHDARQGALAPARAAAAGLVAGLAALAALAGTLLAVAGLVAGAALVPAVLVSLLLAAGAGLRAARAGREAAAHRAASRGEAWLRAQGEGAPVDPVEAVAREARLARRRVLEADLAPPVRLDLEGALDALDLELRALAQRPPGPERDHRLAALRALSTEVEAAVQDAAPREAGAGEDRVEAARRRAAAARAAAREVARRG